jgi:Leucine-rich repeat (LRR) protein
VVLKLSMNPLSEMPNFGRMRALLHLSLAHCELHTLPDEVRRRKRTAAAAHRRCRHCEFSLLAYAAMLPTAHKTCARAPCSHESVRVQCACCCSRQFLVSLPKLATLDVARNHIRALPPPAKHAELTRLFASFNQVRCVLCCVRAHRATERRRRAQRPRSIGDLRGVRHIYAAQRHTPHVHVHALRTPPLLPCLFPLATPFRTRPCVSRDVSRAYQLASVSEEHMNLSLVELDLSHNELATWPDGLGSGGVLERILLAHNRIPALPAAASKVPDDDRTSPPLAPSSDAHHLWSPIIVW